MPKQSEEGLEKLRLLGQLAGDDVRVTTVGVTRNAERPIWKALQESGQISAEMASSFTALDAMKLEEKRLEVERNPTVIKHLIDGLVSITNDSNAVMYVSETLIDLCKADSFLSDVIAASSGSNGIRAHNACYKSLELNWQDAATNDNLAYLLCSLQCHDPVLPDTRNLYKIMVDPKVLRLSATGRLAAISNLLKADRYRVDLFHSSTCRNHISQGMMSKDPSSIYYAVLSLWLWSFNGTIICEKGPMYEHRSLLGAFCDTFMVCKKEKVVRVACSAIKNLITQEWIFELFCTKKIDHTLTLLEYEKWRDQEIYTSIQELLKIFYNKTVQYSNFNRYIKELESGNLKPGPLHNETFWRENVKNFEDNEFSAIKKLSALLLCDEPTTLAVAVFDLGEFCRLHPTGKRLLQRFGAKDQIIKLMSHPNKEIAREALLCTQKFMLDDWRKVGGEAQDKHQKDY